MATLFAFIAVLLGYITMHLGGWPAVTALLIGTIYGHLHSFAITYYNKK